MRKAAEIPEGKGDREGAFSLALTHGTTTTGSPHTRHHQAGKHRAQHRAHARKQQQPIIAERPVHPKRGNGGGGGRGEARRFDGLPASSG